MLLVVVAGCATLLVIMFAVSASRNREIVLQPILKSPMTISSSGVSKDYLEMVTRDTSTLLLNRSPENLQYWMDEILAIASPKHHGRLKAALVRIVTEQEGSSVSQYFTPLGMKVDPKTLTSEVNGILHTVVGSKEVTAEAKNFRFYWEYSGLSLRLKGFGMVVKKDPSAEQNEEAFQ